MFLTAFCSFTPAVKPRFIPVQTTSSNSRTHHLPAAHAKASLPTRGPQTPAPDYSRIDSNPLNRLFTDIFLSKLEMELGRTSTERGYAGVIDVVKQLAARHRTDPKALQNASQRVLMSLFPTWLPAAFSRMFSKPIPSFAAWINAVVTIGVTQWLMGASKLAEDGVTVEIERCRYLEETGCVGICVNSCKKATETFFEENMGLNLSIEPKLEDFSCKFHFGKARLSEDEDEVLREPCFADCPMNSSDFARPCHNVKGVSQ